MEFPSNLRYTKDHEWVSLDGNTATIGITDYAQHELGDIVYVDVPSIGESLNAHDIFGTVEAVKTVSDLYMPISGEVLELNPNLDSNPQDVNTDPYGKGWMIKVAVESADEFNGLLDAAGYKALIGH